LDAVGAISGSIDGIGNLITAIFMFVFPKFEQNFFAVLAGNYFFLALI